MAATALYLDGSNVKAQKYSTDGAPDGNPATLNPRPSKTIYAQQGPNIVYNQILDSTIGPNGTIIVLLGQLDGSHRLVNHSRYFQIYSAAGARLASSLGSRRLPGHTADASLHGIAVNSLGQFLLVAGIDGNRDLLILPGIPTPAANPTHHLPDWDNVLRLSEITDPDEPLSRLTRISQATWYGDDNCPFMAQRRSAPSSWAARGSTRIRRTGSSLPLP